MKRLRRDERGTALPPAAIGLLMVAGVTGMAVEAGHIYLADTDLQLAAEAAAIAGAQALPQGADMGGAIYQVAGGSPSVSDSGTAPAGDEFVVGRWNAETRMFTPAAEPANAVKVTVSRSAAGGNPVPTVFTRLFGIDGVDLEAEAIAAKVRDPICLLALEPTARNAVLVNSNSGIAALDCTVQVNSSSAQAIAVERGGTVTAESICAHGSVAGFGFAPPPETCPPVVDPLTALLPPAGAGAPCDFVDTVIGEGTVQLPPGVYCGQLEIGGDAMVTFLPGVYTIRDAEFIVESGADVAGAGVAFYLTGTRSVLTFQIGSTVRLSAPTMGAMAGILFYQDREVPDGTTHQVDSDSTSYFEGVVYLPNSVLRVNGKAPFNGDADFTVLIARSYEIGSDSTILLNNEYDASSVPMPDGLGRLITLVR